MAAPGREALVESRDTRPQAAAPQTPAAPARDLRPAGNLPGSSRRGELNDSRIPAPRRQSLATQVGGLQGNRSLQSQISPEATAPGDGQMSVGEPIGPGDRWPGADESARRIHVVLVEQPMGDKEVVVRELSSTDLEGMAYIDAAYRRRFGSAIRDDVLSHMNRVTTAIQILGLLQVGNYHDPHIRLGLALIVGLRDVQVMKILQDTPVEQRGFLREAYDDAFRGVGLVPGDDTLEGHLRSHFAYMIHSDWDQKKALVLMKRDLTPAEELYGASLGIVGTEPETVLKILNGEWDKGPEAFAKLEADWKNLVMPQWKAPPLREALLGGRGARKGIMGEVLGWKGELSGETAEIVQAIFLGQDRKRELAAQAARGGQLGPAEQERLRAELDKIDLDLARSVFKAATTGGWTGLGTSEDLVASSVDKMREISERGIARAEKAGDWTAVQARREAWYRVRMKEIEPALRSELSGDELVRAMARLHGALTPADKIYFAKEDGAHEDVLNLVTQAWLIGPGAIEAVREDAARPRNPQRPPYDLDLALSIQNALYVPFRALIRDDLDRPGQGAERLFRDAVGVSGRTRSKDLEAVYKFLKALSAEDLDSVLDAYRAKHLPGDDPRTSRRDAFMREISLKFDYSNTQVDIKDLLQGPTYDVNALAARAQEHAKASSTGWFDKVAEAGAQVIGRFTGQDDVLVNREDLAALDFMAKAAKADPDDLQMMMLLRGKKTVSDLGTLAYADFTASLADVRATKKLVAEVLGSVVDIAGRSVLVALTGGLGVVGGLVSALGALGGGMVVRKSLLGSEYDLATLANLSTLAGEVATFGVDISGAEARVEQVLASSRVRQWLGIKALAGEETWATGAQTIVNKALSKTVEKTVQNMIENKFPLPSVDELAARAVNMLLLGVVKAQLKPFSKDTTIYDPFRERLGRNFVTVLMNGPPPAAALPTAMVKAFTDLVKDPGFANMSGPDIAAKLGLAGLKAAASSISVSLAITYKDFAVTERIRQLTDSNPELVTQHVREDPVLSKGYASYARRELALGRPVASEHAWLRAMVIGRATISDEGPLLGESKVPVDSTPYAAPRAPVSIAQTYEKRLKPFVAPPDPLLPPPVDKRGMVKTWLARQPPGTPKPAPPAALDPGTLAPPADPTRITPRISAEALEQKRSAVLDREE